MDENISRAAGASHGTTMDEAAFRAWVEPIGRTLEERTTLYGRPALERCASRAGTGPRPSRSRPPVLVELGLDVAHVRSRAAEAQTSDASSRRDQRPPGRQALPVGVVGVGGAAALARGHGGTVPATVPRARLTVP